MLFIRVLYGGVGGMGTWSIKHEISQQNANIRFFEKAK
jgi:hypothetical protein